MREFVICAACGAHIKANRTHCLRCEAPLPAPSTERRAPAPSTGLPQTAMGAGAAVGLLVVVLLWVAWPTPPRQAPSSSPGADALTAQLVAASAAAPPGAGAVDGPSSFSATEMDARRAASAAFTTGDLQQAKAGFEQALQRNSDDPEALNGLGLTLERTGDIPGAIARFERATALAGDNWAYHFNLAHAIGRLLAPNWDRAIAEYRQAAQLFPTDYATQFNLAMALQKKGDDREAVPEFEKAIALAPGEPTFHIALGNSLAKAGRLADAQRAFRQYLELEPDPPDAAKVKAHIDTLAAAAAPPPSTPAPAPALAEAAAKPLP